MRFIPLPYESADSVNREAVRGLSAEYRAGHRVGVISLGDRHFFFRKLLTVYFIPYHAISRYFRRVLTVPARIGCCAGGELQIEHLVLCALSEVGNGERTQIPNGAETSVERELAQIQLPGGRAAKIVMEEMKRLAPDAASGKPQAAKGANA